MEKTVPLKWKLFVVALFCVVFALSVFLWTRPRLHRTVFIAVRGKVYELNDETQEPLFNVTVVAVTDGENFVKGFTNETGDFEIWVKYPENLSIPVYVYAYKPTYVECWRNQTMPTHVTLIKETEAYSIYGYVTFGSIVMVKESAT